MDEKCLIQIYIDKNLKNFLKEAAVKDDRSLSSFIRVRMQTVAEKVTGKEYKEGR